MDLASISVCVSPTRTVHTCFNLHLQVSPPDRSLNISALDEYQRDEYNEPHSLDGVRQNGNIRKMNLLNVCVTLKHLVNA